MRKPKVLHLTFDMRIGGTEQVIKNIVQGMQGQKFDHSILCIEQPIGPFGDMLIEEGVTISAFSRKEGFDVSLIQKIRQHIKQNKIDILHCHQYTPWVYGCLAAALTKTKVIFTEHGRFYPDSSSWKRRYINPVLVALTNKITAISAATKQALVDFEFIPQEKIDVIYNGIAPLEADLEKVKELRQAFSIPDDAIILGTVARLDPIKNQTMMIRAFHQVLQKNSNCYLLIVGDGEEREKLQNLCSELAITENVIFTGYVSKPVNHLALMDVFLLPSLSEGTSMTLLEAMSLAIPVAATSVGGTPEIIHQEKSGLLSKNEDLEGYSDSLEKLVSDHALRKAYGAQARADYLNSFATSAMCDAYLSLYQEIRS